MSVSLIETLKSVDTWACSDEVRNTIFMLASEAAQYQLNNLERVTCPDDFRTILRMRYQKSERETFGVILLDAQHRVLKIDELFVGTINAASVYPREVVKLALKYNAAAVTFYHNHPSGSPEPSIADKQITTRLVDALKLVDINTLDHFVLALDGVVSFAERGYL